MYITENYKDEYDYLTEILNRRSGEYRIAEQLFKGEGALAVIDLDNFKMVNDTYGHLMGDYVLKQVADILKRYEKEHVVCRMAGDEFLVYPLVVVALPKICWMLYNRYSYCLLATRHFREMLVKHGHAYITI